MSRAELVVRLLTPDDVDLMEALSTTFGHAFEEVETYTSSRPSAAYLQRLLAGDHFLALVAVKGDEVVGGLAAYTLEKFEQERSEIFIYDLAVASTHRREGIATALLHALEEIASQRGAYLMFIQAEADNDPAVALYRKFGDHEEALSFNIRIDDAS